MPILMGKSVPMKCKIFKPGHLRMGPIPGGGRGCLAPPSRNHISSAKRHIVAKTNVWRPKRLGLLAKIRSLSQN